MILSIIYTVLAALSLGLTVWQAVVAWRFPLHQRSTQTGFTPGITILKPLKGSDSETASCLGSWFAQNYQGPIQILFGVASASDPVCKIVERLISEHPHIPAKLILCSENLGPNAKVSKLSELERLAGHDYLCVSDADVWAPPDFLTNAMSMLSDSRVGLVNGLYRFAAPSNFAMGWEAFAVNADFWSQVLQSISLRPMKFGLGAAMVMPRSRLAGFGGFSQLVQHLADDYHLGRHIAAGGSRIQLCPVVVECRSAPMSFREVWSHQLRWARTIRNCQPVAFFLTVLSNSTLWPILCMLMEPGWFSAVGAALCLCTRGAAGVYLHGKMTGRYQMAAAGMAIVKDVFQLAIWGLAFTGRDVAWRGVNYRVQSGDRLVRLSEATISTLRPA